MIRLFLTESLKNDYVCIHFSQKWTSFARNSRATPEQGDEPCADLYQTFYFVLP